MPRLDGTGPNGAGPMTGRGMGNCIGRMGRGFGCGMGFGRGFGFGRRLTSVDEKVVLEDEKKMLEEELIAVNKELKDLQAK